MALWQTIGVGPCESPMVILGRFNMSQLATWRALLQLRWHRAQ